MIDIDSIPTLHWKWTPYISEIFSNRKKSNIQNQSIIKARLSVLQYFDLFELRNKTVQQNNPILISNNMCIKHCLENLFEKMLHNYVLHRITFDIIYLACT